MTADGWIPTGGRRPYGLADGTLIRCRNATTGGESSKDYCIEEFINWPNLSHYRLAQPAAQEPMFHCKRHGDYPVNESGLCPACQAGDSKYDQPPCSMCAVVGKLCPQHGQERTISPGYFYLAVGREPKDDDMDRSNCKEAGAIAHTQCGWCLGHDKPRFICGCALKLPLPARAAGPSDADQRGAAGGTVSNGQMPEEAQRQSAPRPYRSRNGYGLRIREVDVRPREPLLISYDVFRRMK